MGRSDFIALRIAVIWFAVVSCAPRRPTAFDVRPDAQTADTPRTTAVAVETAPAWKIRPEAALFKAFAGQILVLSNLQFVAEGKWREGGSILPLRSPFAQTGTVDVFIGDNGERIQWLSEDKKVQGGWVAHDRLVFYEPTGHKKGEWQGDGSLSSVHFGWPTLVINGRRLIEIGATGQAKVIRNDVGRARQILYADSRRHIICQKTKVSVTQIDEPDTSGGCESSEGWRFDGSWLSNEPIVCGGKIIEFSAVFGEWRHWVNLNVRNLSTGAIVASVKARGTQSICLLDKIVETASGQSWSAVDGHPLPSLPCSGKPLLWAASHDSAWCLDSTGKIEQLSAQQR